jgi:Ca2+-binding EF-hand superfamily protein
MHRLALIGVVLFSPVISTATLAAPSQEQCTDAWNKADKDADGDLSGSEFTRYLIAIKKDGRHNEAGKDGKLNVDEFMAACKDGVFEGMEDRHR